MNKIYDQLSFQCSKATTQLYSTSFSMGISMLEKKYQEPIYNIYGFVRLADEIVDGSISGSCSGYVSDINNDDQITIIDILLLINMISNP